MAAVGEPVEAPIAGVTAFTVPIDRSAGVTETPIAGLAPLAVDLHRIVPGAPPPAPDPGPGSSVAFGAVVLPVAVASRAIALDLSRATTFRVLLTDDVAAIGITGFATPGEAVRVTIYFVQDATGGRSIAGWPAEVAWTGGAPLLTPTPGAVDCVVLDTLDGGATIYGNLVGLAYSKE